jgi:hypothetical protein
MLPAGVKAGSVTEVKKYGLGRRAQPVNQSTLEVEEKDTWHVIPEQSVAFAVARA